MKRFLLTLSFLLVGVPVFAEHHAKWIWGSSDSNKKALAGRCEFRKQFALSKVLSATIELSCDDRFLLRINNRLVGMSGDWKQRKKYNITPLLVDGENTIYLRCHNLEGTAGCFVVLKAKLRNGKSFELVTDATWEAKLQQAGTWDPGIRNRTPWEKAIVAAEYGDAPWGEIAQATESISVKQRSTGPLQFHDGDRVVLLGGTFIERAQRYGHLETALTVALPETNVAFRNLGWSGDTVFGHARARFGSIDDGFEHLETHVHSLNPNIILVAYGGNAAFAGQDGMQSFSEGLEKLLDSLEATGARIILVSPIKQQNLGPPLPDPAKYNESLENYSKLIQQIATQRNCEFVDLVNFFSESNAVGLTDNGMHLNALGYQHVASVLAQHLRVPARPWHVAVGKNADECKVIGTAISNFSGEEKTRSFTLLDEQLPLPTSERRLVVSGLPSGKFRLTIDGQKVVVASSQAWATGVKVSSGPEFDQTQSVRQQVLAKNELFFHRWRPQNETYLFLFRKHEQGNNAAEIPQFDPLIEQREKLIAKLRVPKTHRYEIKPSH